MKQTLSILLLISILFLSNLSIINAQETCDSTLIALVDVQDNAIKVCEAAYIEMKTNFDLLNDSYRLQNQNLKKSLAIFEHEMARIRSEIEVKELSQKRLIRRRSFQFSVIGISLGFVLGELVQ